MGLRAAAALAWVTVASLLAGCDTCCPSRCGPCPPPYSGGGEWTRQSVGPGADLLGPKVMINGKAGTLDEPEPVAKVWPHVDCGGGQIAAMLLDQIAACAQGQGWPDIMDMVRICRLNMHPHDPLEYATYCQDLRNARDACLVGNHDTCSNELNHPETGKKPK